ncbi:MAG: hypothetical protein P1U37_15500 [Minwuia sp.]|nr:hypothetical protein [Minwuia sp.]
MNARYRTSVLSLVPERLQTSDPPSAAEDQRDSDLSDAPDIQPPPLPGKPQLVELFADSRDGGAVGFALAQIPRAQSILWVQDRMCAQEMGQPHGRALARFGGDPDRLILACARHAGDVLWTMEEGLACPTLGAVIGEIWGEPKALDFTATKRLALRAERTGIAVFLIRFGAATASASVARRRWRVTSTASAPHPHDPRAPGEPRWRTELFRARDARPGTWEGGYDHAAHRLHLAAPLRDPALAATALRREGDG